MMTTIHMDIEAMRRIQNDLNYISGHIQNKLQALRRNHQGLPNNWISNSANEYFDYYAEFEGNVKSIMDKISDIASELSAEVTNYESMDKGLGG